MRCYDGAPDKNLQALLDDSKLAHKQLKSLGLTATYFPVEQKMDCISRSTTNLRLV